MRRYCDNRQGTIPPGVFDSHLYDEFELRAKAVSAEVFRVTRADEAINIILAIVNDTGVKTVASVSCPLIEASGIVDALKGNGVAVYTEQARIAEHIGVADIGMSGVAFGIAECGSVCQDALAVETRLVSSLPPLHIAFMKSRNIVPGIEEALEIISGFFTAGYVSWITGPSRTADIERVLTIGVHGPARLVIIAVDEGPDEGAA